jgi:antirestriction protein ArdC
MNINALYESVTNGIIKEMEAGAVQWAKPWMTPRGHGSVMPHNLATGRPYSGINAIQVGGLTSTRWRSCAPSGPSHDRGGAGSATSRSA